MNILIVGAGKVGKTLAVELSKENHEIYVLDKNEEVLREVSTLIDCMGVIGEAASLTDLKQANVEKCDLLLSMTSSDEINILACLFARKANPGIKTIARVRNPLYANDINYIKEELGLTMVVNPEEITAREIAKIIRIPEAMKVETFSKSRVQMITLHLPKESKLVGKKVYEISNAYSDSILIVGIHRVSGEIIIPGGGDVIEEGDEITFLATPYDMASFFEKTQIVKKPVKKVMIVGGSSIAYYLAKSLSRSHLEVGIIDNNPKKCEELSEKLDNVVVICGDATEDNLLLEEGINDVDAFVSLTGVDETNVMLSLYASHAKDFKVVTKVNHINYDTVLSKLELGTVISPKQILADHIIRYVRGFSNAIGSSDIITLYRILNNQAEVLSFRINKESSVTNVSLKNLKFKNDVLIGSIIRNDKVIIPNGDTKIQINDQVLVVTKNLGLDKIEGIIQ